MGRFKELVGAMFEEVKGESGGAGAVQLWQEHSVQTGAGGAVAIGGNINHELDAFQWLQNDLTTLWSHYMRISSGSSKYGTNRQ